MAVADDKDDNSVFACPVASPVGAMLMPALGDKNFLFSSRIGAPPELEPAIFKKINFLVGAPIREWCVVAC